MSPISYAFNHNQLLSGIGTQGCEKIVFSLCNLKVPSTGKTSMHMIARFFGANGQVINSNDEEIGCPYPPGWKDGGKYTVLSSQLEQAPTFAVSKTDLSAALEANDFVKEEIKQLIVSLEGDAAEDNLSTFLTINPKNINGVNKASILKATAFPIEKTAVI